MAEQYRFVALNPYGTDTRAVDLRIVAQDERSAEQFQKIWTKMYTALKGYHESTTTDAPGWTRWSPADWYKDRKTVDRQKFAAWVGDVVVGFLNVRDAYPSQFDSGHKLLYIEHIATAPGNILQDIWGSRLKAVGTALIAYSIMQSIRLGHDGRIGLHAADKTAADYYEGLAEKHKIWRNAKWGIAGTPEDRRAVSRPYYESDPGRARAFLEGYRDE